MQVSAKYGIISNGPGRIRTFDQWIMSPLNEDDKGPKSKDLANADPVVDRKTDSKKPKTLQNQARIDTSRLPPELAEIIAVWSELPEHIKAAIKALIQARKGEDT